MEPPKTFFEVLQPVWWISLVSFLVALIATPLCRWIAYRTRVVDRPDSLLKPHGRPVAYLGGVAMFLGLFAGLAGYAIAMPHRDLHLEQLGAQLGVWRTHQFLRNPMWNVIAIGASSLVVMLVGLVDDLYCLSPRKKILGQVLAAAILLGGGVGERMSVVIFGSLDWVVPNGVVIAVSSLMCIFMVIATCNAVNLIDGLDGLCGGVTGIITVGFLALATFLAMWCWPGRQDIDSLRVGLCLAMVGTVLGFLPYNIPPASIFMGDAGSMLLGFFVAMMMALFCTEGNPRWFLSACAVFTLPMLDTSLAVVRRLLAGKSIFAGDRSHLYDQLVDRGMSVKQVVGLFYVLAAAVAALGFALALIRVRYAIGIYLAVIAFAWAIFAWTGMVRSGRRGERGGE